MKDFVGQELNVGDKIVHGVGGRGGGLSGPYIVASFTPKMVRVKRVGSTSEYSSCVPPHNLVKVIA